MAWTQPKVDWESGYNAAGEYTGDYFGHLDYNRIKNNLRELRTMAIKLHPTFRYQAMSEDKIAGDYLYADEINAIENNLDTLCRNTFPTLAGTKKNYYENTATMNYAELNRIERCCRDVYENLKNQEQGRPALSFLLGTGGRF